MAIGKLLPVYSITIATVSKNEYKIKFPSKLEKFLKAKHKIKYNYHILENENAYALLR